jgi:hypothetical protein
VEAVSGLPLERLAGPDPARWTPSPLPIDTYSDSHEQRVRSAAYHAWMAAGRAWEAKADLPHGQRWTELLPPELAYVAKSLGRAHVIAGGLGPPQGPGKVGSRSV